MKYHTNPKYLTLIKSKFGDNAEQNIKMNYKIIFGKVRPKEDDDD